MSLKFFHGLFIILSIILLAGFGYWCLQKDAQEILNYATPLAVLSFLLSLTLVFYFLSFLKKIKKIH